MHSARFGSSGGDIYPVRVDHSDRPEITTRNVKVPGATTGLPDVVPIALRWSPPLDRVNDIVLVPASTWTGSATRY